MERRLEVDDDVKSRLGNAEQLIEIEIVFEISTRIQFFGTQIDDRHFDFSVPIKGSLHLVDICEQNCIFKDVKFNASLN